MGLTKWFGRGPSLVRAVDGIDLEVRSRELVLVTGPSGSGKSTLLSMLGGMLRPNSNEVLVAGESLFQPPFRAEHHPAPGDRWQIEFIRDQLDHTDIDQIVQT